MTATVYHRREESSFRMLIRYPRYAFNTKDMCRRVAVRGYDYVTNASIVTRTPLTTIIRKLCLGVFGHIIMSPTARHPSQRHSGLRPPSSWIHPIGPPPIRWADQIEVDFVQMPIPIFSITIVSPIIMIYIH